MFRDLYDVPIKVSSIAAVDYYNDAARLIRLYRGDPIAALDAALAVDPDFTMAWAARAGLLAMQGDALYGEELERSLRAGFACAEQASARERAHLGAAKMFAEGRLLDATAAYGRIAHDCPRDLIAVQYAHLGCFYLGLAHELRDGPVQALRAFVPGDEGRHAVLGMAAFGYEESGQYGIAEEMGREAVSLEPRDGWAVHAVAHVNEMRGDVEKGKQWLIDGAPQWSPDSGFSYHNWWHLALLHLDHGEHAEALRLYDERVRPAPSDVLLEWVDASALLWRLRLEGVDVGDRFVTLAEHWSRAAEDGFYAFNDVHAVMAFVAAGRELDAARVLRAMRKAASGVGDNAYFSAAVGLPLAEAVIAFEAKRYSEAVEKILRVRPIANRFGGSHAQRDILTLTALHAALRGGMKRAAQALAAERVAHKPQSPWARNLAQRAASLGAASLGAASMAAE